MAPTTSSIPAGSPSTQLADADFKKFSEFVYRQVGIKLTPAKKTLVEARLQKRMHALGMNSHREYVRFLLSPAGLEHELVSLIDAVTTNTTHFFRENAHFEYLKHQVLPQWLLKNGRYRTMRFWSAGCSIGMEPYTLAIVLSEFARVQQGFEFAILGTDISTKALKEAIAAVYPLDRVEAVPQEFKERYMLRGRGNKSGLVRMSPEIRKCVEFCRLNFMEEFSFDKPFDVVFCRNVVIYFDRPTQERLFQKLGHHLKMGGHLFIGHSESMAGMDVPLHPVAPTVYRKG